MKNHPSVAVIYFLGCKSFTSSYTVNQISPLENHLLFHFPNRNRDSIYAKHKIAIPELYRYKDKYLENFHKDNYKDKDPNQIEIKLKHVTNLEYIKSLIDEAFKFPL